ncbi:MAG: hypothetical protein FWC91_14365 [Defluviitaleaceae bacterium]|nr:hypothetical protein [Defluviitaleaceae bacterium]
MILGGGVFAAGIALEHSYILELAEASHENFYEGLYESLYEIEIGEIIFSAALAGTGNPPGLITQRTYTFDNRGNRRSMTNSRHRYTVVYTYDLNNRLLSSTSTNGLGEQEITRYTYDRNGNQLTETIGNHTITNTYNTFNQLIGVTMPGMISSYTYRADGLRHSKTVNGATRIHGWNGRHIVIEYNAGGMIFNIFHRKINGNLIRSHQHGYYLFNARGDVVQRVDKHGAVLHTYRYSAFGLDIGRGDSSNNPFRFAGEYYDWETSTIYLRARNFNPRTGRFMQPDPHWNVNNMIFGDNPVTRNNRRVPNGHAIMQAGNLFVFTMNNPVMFVDPSGRIAIPAIKGGGAAALRALGRALTSVTPVALPVSNLQTPNAPIRPATTAPTVPPPSPRPTPPPPRSGPSAPLPIPQPAPTPAPLTPTSPQISELINERVRTDGIPRNQLQYFEAVISTYRIGPQPIRALTYAEAVAHIISVKTNPKGELPEFGVFALTEAHAQHLIYNSKVGGPCPSRSPQPENHGIGQSGFFYHYHPRANSNAHIWFFR